MKKRSIPGKSDLEAIRNQILDFACVAHDFRAETDEFLHNGDWNGVFVGACLFLAEGLPREGKVNLLDKSISSLPR